MELNKKVSIIVPVYNVAEYLEDCLNSLVNQSYENIEIISINDGSKDNSLEILKTFAEKDLRIKVFDNENHGVSYTRNFGIKNCTGDYIAFVDSDDIVAKNYIEVLVNSL
ncbi:MAG: glycosyltransferase family 2 protein, partial [Clostridia bacterium]|nr:glycosyltransferase family 2 protein [Clostridia bacterium]